VSYKTRRYQEGLSGKRPGVIYVNKEGHRSQEAGYRDYLRNEDLADRIRQANEPSSSDSNSYRRTPVADAVWRVVSGLIGLAILRGALAVLLTDYFDLVVIKIAICGLQIWVSLWFFAVAFNWTRK
jgi:hypothetical protein